jgi:hypothetical protein
MTEPLILKRGRKTGIKCASCHDTGWVCESHPAMPWDGPAACGCGAAGMPCPDCNPSDRDHPPRLPAGFQRDETLDDE